MWIPGIRGSEDGKSGTNQPSACSAPREASGIPRKEESAAASGEPEHPKPSEEGDS